ncbi:unnamed protein product [Paramecium sonneborni]|uniref:Uncharacterized protein n=1 Tax=Paramecium sonneborni TaxID=65129 RepID=A0A8S1QLS3_9CILI|nr:unnamed protein product [Paramecium sonneborni]
MATNNLPTFYPGQQQMGNLQPSQYQQQGGGIYQGNQGVTQGFGSAPVSQQNQQYLYGNQYGLNNNNQGVPSYQTPQRMASQRVMQQSPQTMTSPIIQQQAPMIQQQVPIIQQQQAPIIQQYQAPIIQQQQVQQTVQQYQPSVIHNVEHVPVIHELHHVNRPINVVSVDEIEGPWRSKVLLLEKQLIELQLMLKKGPVKQLQSKQVVVEDEGKIRQLQSEIERLQGILRENQKEIEELEQQINEATYSLENADEQAASQVEAQSQELAKWKKKFSDLNKQYHDIEEDITMTEAQIESIQKRKMITQTSSTIKTTSKVQGGTYADGDVRKSGFSNRNY